MTKPANTDLVAARANITQAKQLASALLPELVERLGVQTMMLDDPEVTGKAIDRLAKLVGVADDRGNAMKPIIHFTITSSGANMSVQAQDATPLVEELTEATKPVFQSPFVVPSDVEDAVLVQSKPLLATTDE